MAASSTTTYDIASNALTLLERAWGTAANMHALGRGRGRLAVAVRSPVLASRLAAIDPSCTPRARFRSTMPVKGRLESPSPARQRFGAGAPSPRADRSHVARGTDRGTNKRTGPGIGDVGDPRKARIARLGAPGRTPGPASEAVAQVRILPGAPCLTCDDVERYLPSDGSWDQSRYSVFMAGRGSAYRSSPGPRAGRSPSRSSTTTAIEIMKVFEVS